MPKVSVIIPCFNLGEFLCEAIDSVFAQTFQDFEIIVVNDGSTDSETNKIIESLSAAKIKVISTTNQGLSAARNNGISEAAGEYILPLDADDKIAFDYLEKAVKILDQHENIGIVYCKAEFFGEENFEWDLPDFELSRMLIDNLIFCSAFFRRKDWKAVGGYRLSMIYGWEDYDFWLSLIEIEREVYRIPEILFFYRSRADSMANLMSRENLFYSYKQIVENHKILYLNNIEYLFKNIYSLRDNIGELQQQQTVKDTKIHYLNLEVIGLQKKNTGLQTEFTSLEAKFFSLRAVARQLYVLIKINLSAFVVKVSKKG